MEDEDMKKRLLAGLAAGLLMAGTAIAAPYSENLLGNPFDSQATHIVSHVTVPDTLLLIGIGMLSLAVSGKRKMNKDA